MANTGWQIVRSILAVASTDNSKLLDRNGLECNSLSVDGVPISSAGLKQAAKVLSTVSADTEFPPGQTKTYSQLYDIVERYDVTTTNTSTSVLLYQDGVVVGRYKGSLGDTCEVSNIVVFTLSSGSATSTTIPGEANLSADIEFGVVSSIGADLIDWSITSFPSWLTVSKISQTLLKITSWIDNPETGSRLGNIVLTQNVSGETLEITITQETKLIVNGYYIASTGPRDHKIIFQQNVNSNLVVNVLIHYSDGTSAVSNTNVPFMDAWAVITALNKDVTSMVINSVTPGYDDVYIYTQI